MVYSDNPYIDIIVHNTKMLGIDTVLKMPAEADRYEDKESHSHGDKLLMCKDGTVTLKLLYDGGGVPEEVLRKAGLGGILLFECMKDWTKVPPALENKVLYYGAQYFIDNYEDLNPYYRMLSGLPPIGHEDYITDWEPPEGIKIDISGPVHLMSPTTLSILNTYGVLDELYEKDRTNRAYIKYLDRKIDPYKARKASMFEVLYIPNIDSAEIEKEYLDRLEVNRDYVVRSVYSDAYRFESDYYDNIMAILIILNAMMDIVSRVEEFIARREVFDLRTCRYIFESYGVDFFPEIPFRYQVKMVKNLHTLLKYKSTSKCIVDICSLFGFDDIKVFKYYLLRQHKQDKGTFEYSFTGDSSKDYSLKFVKIPIDGRMAEYIRDPDYHIAYDEITGEPTWDGGLKHEDVKKQMTDWDFNYSRTKYLSIDALHDIAKISAQQSYFFNMLYDNYELEGLLNVSIPAISTQKDFNLADVFTFLTSLTHFYNGNKDLIFDTQGKLLYVNGFNFRADLALIAEQLNELAVNGNEDDEAQEILKKFNIPKDSIPNIKTLMDIFVNNLDIRDELLTLMRKADRRRYYIPLKKVYDSLMTLELTMDHFKNPETGDFYRDAEGDATYQEYLANKDPVLYAKLVEIQLMDDDESRVNYITTLVDNICYILEEWIDSEEFSGIFKGLPGVSVEAVQKYIMEVIDFYVSYKAHILGINTIYFFKDINQGYIHLIDDIMLHRYFEKTEILQLIDQLEEIMGVFEWKEPLKIYERIYFIITTWKNYSYDEWFDLIIKLEMYIRLKREEYITIDQRLIDYINELYPEDFIFTIDYIMERLSYMNPKESLAVKDNIWIVPIEYDDE